MAERFGLASDTDYSRGPHRSSSSKRSTSRHRGTSCPPSGSSLRNIIDSRNSKHTTSHVSQSGGKSSYYRRSPRTNYLSRTLKKIRRLLRDLFYYMKRHPYKVLILVIIPLFLSGIFAKILAKIGIRLPLGLQKALNHISRGSGEFLEERHSTGMSKFFNTAGGILGGLGGAGGAMKIIKMFK